MVLFSLRRLEENFVKRDVISISSSFLKSKLRDLCVRWSFGRCFNGKNEGFFHLDNSIGIGEKKVFPPDMTNLQAESFLDVRFRRLKRHRKGWAFAAP